MLSDEYRRLARGKSNKVRVIDGVPGESFGKDGDFVIANTKSGVRLYVKVSRVWLHVGLLEQVKAKGDGKQRFGYLDDKTFKIVKAKRELIAPTEQAPNPSPGSIRIDVDDGEIHFYAGAAGWRQYGGASTSASTPSYSSSTENLPRLTMTNSNTDKNGAVLKFVKDVSGHAGANDDIAGVIEFWGDDAVQTNIPLARIEGYIANAVDGAERGGLKLFVTPNAASSLADQEPGLTLEGTATTDEVDVTIGNGAASMTTVAGDLTVTGADVVIGADADGTDRSITFGHTTNKCIMGIDDDQDKFAIHTGAAFVADNDFELASNGKATFNVITTLTGGIEVGANAAKWSDGFHGNADGIVLVPADFTLANATWDFARAYFTYIDTTDGSESLVNHADVSFICQKIIPKGFTATGTTLYGDSWSGVNALTAFGGDVTDETATQLFNGAKVPTANNTFDGAAVGGANSVVSGGKQYVTLIVNPAATADTIHGGVIHIERTAA